MSTITDELETIARDHEQEYILTHDVRLNNKANPDTWTAGSIVLRNGGTISLYLEPYRQQVTEYAKPKVFAALLRAMRALHPDDEKTLKVRRQRMIRAVEDVHLDTDVAAVLLALVDAGVMSPGLVDTLLTGARECVLGADEHWTIATKHRVMLEAIKPPTGALADARTAKEHLE